MVFVAPKVLRALQLRRSMGRYRRVSNSADEDPSHRSRRKRATSSGEDLQSANTGQGTGEGKRALHRCNYCNKDICGKIHIKCVKCPNFDLCVECFSVGAEVTPHKSNHPYRVMDNLSFPLISPDWNAEEEILLLEGIEMYGLGNWAIVAEHIGTKSKSQCIDHYTTAYMNSPFFPLPYISPVVGNNGKQHGEGKKGFPTLMELTLKEESPLCPSRAKIEEATLGQSLSNLTVDGDSKVDHSSTNIASASAVKKASNMIQIKDSPIAIKVEDSHINRSVRGKKPNSSGNVGPSMINLSGYNSHREEFDPEYDNNAEQPLAEMEFKDTDTEAERELKLRMLRIYLKRLDERKHRKDFILERNLLHPDPLEKELSPEERAICEHYKVFMRFHSKDEHEELIKTVLGEHRLRKKIQELKEARAAGCNTAAEADIYHEQKRNKEAEEDARKAKDGTQVGPTGKVWQRVNLPKGEPDCSLWGGLKGSTGLGYHVKDSPMQASANSFDDWDITGLPGSNLLSEIEQQLCRETKMHPSQYLKMQEVMSMEIFKGNITKKLDAYRIFRTDPSKVGGVYDMLVKKGIALP